MKRIFGFRFSFFLWNDQIKTWIIHPLSLWCVCVCIIPFFFGLTHTHTRSSFSVFDCIRNFHPLITLLASDAFVIVSSASSIWWKYNPAALFFFSPPFSVVYCSPATTTNHQVYFYKTIVSSSQLDSFFFIFIFNPLRSMEIFSFPFNLNTRARSGLLDTFLFCFTPPPRFNQMEMESLGPCVLICKFFIPR